MRLLILSLLALLASDSFSQANQPISFLIVQTGRDYDPAKEVYYSTIQTNNSSQSLTDLLQIEPYKPGKKKRNEVIAYYKEQTDTAARFYNYFGDEREVLQFITSKGWELFSVISQITSYADQQLVNGQYQVYTKITSTPTYYFRKPSR